MYLVVFRNRKRIGLDHAAYEADAQRMEALARQQPGFLSFKSYTAEDGEVIAMSEWENEAAARALGQQRQHCDVQAKGRADYYENYTLLACDNPRISSFDRSAS